MDNVGRLLLRFVLVPLGYVVAVMAGALVILFGSWKIGQAAVDPNAQAIAIFGFVFAGPVLLVLLLSTMWIPGSIGVLISEAFAIRSWMFHAGNGAVSAWIGWSMFGYVDNSHIPINGPIAVIAAGARRRICLLAGRRLERGLLETGVPRRRIRAAASRRGGAATA